MTARQRQSDRSRGLILVDVKAVKRQTAISLAEVLTPPSHEGNSK